MQNIVTGLLTFELSLFLTVQTWLGQAVTNREATDGLSKKETDKDETDLD